MFDATSVKMVSFENFVKPEEVGENREIPVELFLGD